MPGRETFPRRERLTTPREYREVFEHGRKDVGEAFICYVTRREGQGRKLGMAVSRKVGNAVIRNRVKRSIREVYRKCRATLDDDVRIVIVARPPSARLTYVESDEALRGLFRSGGVLRG